MNMSQGNDDKRIVGLPAERLARRLAALPRESLLAEIDALYSHVPVGLVLFDRALTFVRLNETLAEMNGVPVDGHLGRSAFEIVPDLMRTAAGPFMRVFETGEAVRDVEVRGETPRVPGVERVWRESVFPVKGPSGAIEHILVTVEELTELERAERRADLAENHLDLALRTRNIGTFEHGETLDDITWSPAVYEFYGLPADQPVPLAKCLEMSPPEDLARLDEVRRRTLSGEILPPTEYSITRADGSVRWLSVVARRFDTRRGRRVIGIYEDITDRVLAQHALKESEAQKAYLLRLSDALRPLADPVAVEEAACRLLADELGAERCHYTEIDAKRGGGYIHFEYRRHPDATSVIGWHDFASFPSFAKLLAGETFIEPDVARSSRLTPEERETLRAWGVGAVVDLPIVKSGRVTGELVVAMGTAHAWTTVEIRLIEETAERTWASVERARAQAALARSESRFRTLADTVPALVWQTDPEGETLFLNRRYLDFAGMPAEAFRGRKWIGLIHPDDVAAQSAAYIEATRSRRPWQGRMRVRQHDGTWRWIDAHAEPFVDAYGAYQGQVGVALDVTDKVMAEAALRDSEGRFRVLVERIHQVFYVADLKANRALYVSPAFEEIWGRPGAPLLENLSSLIDTVHPEDRAIMEAHAKAAMAGQVSTHEYRIVRPDGTIRWILDRSFPVEGSEGERSAGLAMDITAQKEQAVALGEAVAQKEMLLQEIQHRVKNSLALVNSLLQLQAGAAADTEVRAALSAAAGRVRTIAQLHDQLYRLGDLTDVDLSACLFDVATAVADQAARSPGVRLRTELDRIMLPGKSALAVLLIVNELLTNAYKYAFPNDRAGTVRLSMEQADGEVRIIVADDGVGMPDAKTRRVGLGSRVTQGLAAQLRGRLEHVPGPGCTFVVTFPAASRGSGASGPSN
jgi:PAS domain S-box-containing protein